MLSAVKNTEKDKKEMTDCFAYVGKNYCNALSIKNCSQCSFYKSKQEVPNYQKYLLNSKKGENEKNEK